MTLSPLSADGWVIVDRDSGTIISGHAVAVRLSDLPDGALDNAMDSEQDAQMLADIYGQAIYVN